MINKNIKSLRIKRQIRVRRKIRGTEKRPRLSVYKSNRFIYAQIIDDEKEQTLIGISEKKLEGKILKRLDRAKALGLFLAKKCKEKNISQVVFDKGSHLYHGAIKALAEGAREGGLEF